MAGFLKSTATAPTPAPVPAPSAPATPTGLTATLLRVKAPLHHHMLQRRLQSRHSTREVVFRSRWPRRFAHAGSPVAPAVGEVTLSVCWCGKRLRTKLVLEQWWWWSTSHGIHSPKCTVSGSCGAELWGAKRRPGRLWPVNTAIVTPPNARTVTAKPCSPRRPRWPSSVAAKPWPARECLGVALQRHSTHGQHVCSGRPLQAAHGRAPELLRAAEHRLPRRHLQMWRYKLTPEYRIVGRGQRGARQCQ